MRRSMTSSLAFALGLLGAVADAKPVSVLPAQQGNGVAITDTRDRALRFDQPVSRVAACSSFALETLVALGVDPVARFDVPPVYPPEAESIPVVARSHGTGPDVEQLLAADPDVILLHDVFHAFADDVQRSTRTPVLLHRVDSINDIRQHITMLAELTGREPQGKQLNDEIDHTLRWINSQPRPDAAPRVVSLFGTNDAWFAHRGNAFMGDLLDTLGADNIAADKQAHDRYRSLAPVDVEQLITLDPQVIFITQYNDADDSVVTDLMNHPAFRALTAVRNGRVHVLDAPIYTSHAGPRVGQALRTLYAHLYPDAADHAAASASPTP